MLKADMKSILAYAWRPSLGFLLCCLFLQVAVYRETMFDAGFFRSLLFAALVIAAIVIRVSVAEGWLVLQIHPRGDDGSSGG